jgi:hypothetical protein
MTDSTKTPAATAPATFTVADRARALKIDPKVARRKMRGNLAKDKPMGTPKVVANVSRKNARYEYKNTEANVAMIDSILMQGTAIA